MDKKINFNISENEYEEFKNVCERTSIPEDIILRKLIKFFIRGEIDYNILFERKKNEEKTENLFPDDDSDDLFDF